MFKGLLGVFTDSNDRALKKLWPLVQRINSLEPSLQALDDAGLREHTRRLKERLDQGEELDDILPEAFAAVREAAVRALGQRHYDVQLLGGIVLHQGRIAEMKTGEGKTLVATLPAYLNALSGNGVHVVTVNDYLARRDTQWMGPVYHLLGLTVACLQHEAAYTYDPTVESETPSLRHLRPISRREAYAADITYGTNNEFGFDYLRDNMVLDLAQMVQRELHYAIVDEVDNILIDEARTPLIISGPAEEATKLYQTFASLVPRLRNQEDYTVEEKTRSVTLTPEGIAKIEAMLRVENLYAPENYHLVHYLENALRAHAVYKRDRDYVVKDGEVIIVDEFTGRLMHGRRYAEGLHQAIEAKEHVRIQREMVTYATITIQNYFRMYRKLAGMTGTASTEAEEFYKIYKLDVVTIPTHKPMVRQDFSDLVYKTEKAKWEAVVTEIEEMHKVGRPVLVGTTSIENSERLSAMLQRRGIPHEVLNAKHHEREAQIIAQAGRVGAVTVATNMAGRGTDIILGGNPEGLLLEELRKQGHTLDSAPAELVERLRQEVYGRWQEEHDKVVALGGLHVLGTEHHEARRIDNQLRGRSGRQGDPGSSRFYVSLEDELMRRFGGDRIRSIMNWAGIQDDVPIENGMVTRAIGNAQVKVETFHFDIRKQLLDYDDVLNRHREVIYAERRKVLEGTDLKANIRDMVVAELDLVLDAFMPGRDPETWDTESLVRELQAIMPLAGALADPKQLRLMSRDEVREALLARLDEVYAQREQELGPEAMRTVERLVMLRVMDSHWVHHLTAMENLRQGIGLQAYGQRDPLVAYKTEGHRMYSDLLERIRHQVARTIFHVTLQQRPAPQAQAAQEGNGAQAQQRQPDGRAVPQSPMTTVVGNRARQAVPAGATRIGRNDPCYCGSGKKYKKCHGATA